MLKDAITQMAALPHWVQLWMRWLNIVFLLGLFFVGSHVAAQWAIAAYVISLPAGFIAFFIVRDIRMTGLAHILFWTPLLVYMTHMAFTDAAFRWVSPFGVWTLALCLTMAVSIALDVKGIGDVVFQRCKH